MRLLAFGAALVLLAYLFRESRQQRVVPDDELITKLRLRLNGLLEHPGSVNIAVLEGRVTLTGPVAGPELRRAMRALRAMPGVRRIDCRLTPHAVAV